MVYFLAKLQAVLVSCAKQCIFVLMLTNLSDQMFDQHFLNSDYSFFLAAVGIFHTHTHTG